MKIEEAMVRGGGYAATYPVCNSTQESIHQRFAGNAHIKT